MKCELLTQIFYPKLPEVGQCWKQKGDNTIFMRVEDSIGEALKELNESSFFSIKLENGSLYETSKSAKDMVILTPVGGKVAFEQV